MFLFFLAFGSGILVKLTDGLADRNNLWAFLPAILYGLGLAYLISHASFAILFLAAVLAQGLANKLDRSSHVLGAALAFFGAFYFGFPVVSLPLFFLFLSLAYLDELPLPGRWHWFSEYRLFLKMGALVVAVLLNRWDYFLAIVIFDAGYLITDFLTRAVTENK